MSWYIRTAERLRHIACLRRCFRLIRITLWDALDRLACFSLTTSKANAVLIVRVDNIGDFVLWLDSARHLKKYFSGQHLVLAANRSFAGLAGRCDCFDRIIAIDVGRLREDRLYRFRMLKQIRRVCASIAIQPTFSRVMATGDALIRASGATLRVGSTGDLTNMTASERAIADRWYTQLIPAANRPLMEIERHCEFMRGLGVQEIIPAVARLAQVADLPSALQINSDYFVLFPGASSCLRLWPVDSFGAIARAICDAYGWRVVVCGSEADSALARRLVDEGPPSDAIDLSGQTSLPEFVEVVRRARLLIGNETSAVHIAAAVGTPAVCLLGGGHYGRFMPYSESVRGTKPVAVFRHMSCFGCNWRCHLPHPEDGCGPCISAIPVQAVIMAARHALLRPR